MFNKLIHITIFGAFLLSACGGAATTNNLPTQMPEPAKGSLPALTDTWTISMTHSGGIMGLLRSVEIISTGSYTVKDERSDKNIAGQLSEEELANVIEVVNSSTYSQNKNPAICADCFIYDIVITGDGGEFSAQVNDISIEESGLSPLVTILRGIIERDLK